MLENIYNKILSRWTKKNGHPIFPEKYKPFWMSRNMYRYYLKIAYTHWSSIKKLVLLEPDLSKFFNEND